MQIRRQTALNLDAGDAPVFGGRLTLEAGNSWFGRSVMIQLDGWEMEATVEARLKDMLVVRERAKGRIVYIPWHQVRGVKAYPSADGAAMASGSGLAEAHKAEIVPNGYRAMLQGVKGSYSEVRLSRLHVLHGYLAGVMNDFSIFCTPLHGAVLIPMHHLQALSPYFPGTAPYRLGQEQFPLRPLTLGLARNFEQQLERLEGEMAVICRGGLPDCSGVVGPSKDGMMTMTEADGQEILLPVSAIHALFI
ncbi:hypothetical protein M3223_05530 [Paenibacillus pasadenensis]|nr:hypothetical protein [Paenibacillus pasadenensis]